MTKMKGFNGVSYIVLGSGTKGTRYWFHGATFVWLGETANGIGFFCVPVCF